MAEVETSKAFVTFRQLGGGLVDPDVVLEEIRRLPLDGILGFLAIRSIAAVQAGPDFDNPRHQGYDLNLAIVDDFPTSLPNAHKMYAPGRVPFTNGHHILVHEHNLVWLAHHALLHAQHCDTPEISLRLQQRLARLLLIANDLIPSSTRPSTLIERRTFVIDWLRHAQFNTFFEHSPVTTLKLARQHILMRNILPKYFPSFEEDFREATGGVSLERYFQMLAMVIALVHHDMGPEKQWVSKDRFTSAIKAGHDAVERIFRRWIRTPSEYASAWSAWRGSRPEEPRLASYDYVPLRETPFIEARPNELVCPVLPLLLAKIEDEPYYLMCDHLKKRPQDQRRFFNALGNAYQEYAGSLIERIARSDKAGPWQIRQTPKSRTGAELADTYMQRGAVAVTFEHKGQRPGTEFLRGGEGDRIVGPDESVLRRLEQHEVVDLRHARDHDNGFLTKGMWQQSIAAQSLSGWATEEFGAPADRIYPVITHLASFRPDQVTRRGYLHQLIDRARLYAGANWWRPEWMHIGDLEGLAALADQGLLNLDAVLEEKAERHPDQRFDVFLFQKFAPDLMVDQRLHVSALALMKEAGLAFYKEDLNPAESTDET